MFQSSFAQTRVWHSKFSVLYLFCCCRRRRRGRHRSRCCYPALLLLFSCVSRLFALRNSTRLLFNSFIYLLLQFFPQFFDVIAIFIIYIAQRIELHCWVISMIAQCSCRSIRGTMEVETASHIQITNTHYLWPGKRKTAEKKKHLKQINMHPSWIVQAISTLAHVTLCVSLFDIESQIQH